MVLAFIAKNQESKANPTTAEAISAGTGVFKLTVYKILKGLMDSKQVSIIEKSNPIEYVLVNKVMKGNQDAILPKIIHQEKIGKNLDMVKLNSKGRDTSRITFQGVEYPKSRFVLIIIKTHIEKNPKITLAKLKETFPDELQPRYAVTQLLHQGRKLSEGGRERYFLKPDEILKVGGETKICVCNQWGVGNITPFLKLARSLGYKFK
eukprot:gene4016-5744_t